MEYLKDKEFVFQFAERINHNLSIIENTYENYKPAYEVTQLIASLMGLIVIPQERSVVLKNPQTKTALKKLLEKNTKTKNGEKVSLPKTLKYMRHALSHSHVFFLNGSKTINGHREIERIEFINCCNDSLGLSPCKANKKNNNCRNCRYDQKSIDKPDFVLTLTVNELKQAVNLIVYDFLEQAKAENQKNNQVEP